MNPLIAALIIIFFVLFFGVSFFAWAWWAPAIPRDYGNPWHFLTALAAILFGIVSVLVAVDLSNLQRNLVGLQAKLGDTIDSLQNLQKSQREDAALDRVSETLRWWHSHVIEEQELRLLSDDPANSLIGQFECIIYLKDRLVYTPLWIKDKLHVESYLMNPEALGTDPNPDKAYYFDREAFPHLSLQDRDSVWERVL